MPRVVVSRVVFGYRFVSDALKNLDSVRDSFHVGKIGSSGSLSLGSDRRNSRYEPRWTVTERGSEPHVKMAETMDNEKRRNVNNITVEDANGRRNSTRIYAVDWYIHRTVYIAKHLVALPLTSFRLPF